MKGGFYPWAVLLSAACALATEIAIVRLGAPYVGQSLIPWSMAIASVLTGLTIGHLLGGWLGGTEASANELRTRLAAAWLCGGVAALAMPLLVATLARNGWIGGDDPWIPALLVAAAGFPSSVAAGTASPLAVRILITLSPEHRSQAIARIYAAGAAGSVGGTIAAGLALLDRIGASGVAAVIAAIWIALAAVTIPARTPWRIAIAATGLALCFAAAGITPCQIESRYTCIRMFDAVLPDGGLLRFMQLDEGIHSASERDHAERLHLGYAALANRLAAPLLQGSGQHALVIGGGGNTLPRAWAALTPAVQVTSIEIDAKVAFAAATSMWATPSQALVTRIGDGRVLMKTVAAGSQQVILMDAYRSRGIPPHLVTREFNQLAHDRLAQPGVFLANVIDRGRAPLLAASVATTLAIDFPAVDLWISDATSDEGLTNIVVAAWSNADTAVRPPIIAVDATILPAGGPARTEPSHWRRIDAKFIAHQWPGLCTEVLTDDRAPVEALLAGRVHCIIQEKQGAD